MSELLLTVAIMENKRRQMQHKKNQWFSRSSACIIRLHCIVVIKSIALPIIFKVFIVLSHRKGYDQPESPDFYVTRTIYLLINARVYFLAAPPFMISFFLAPRAYLALFLRSLRCLREELILVARPF
jgi:hypothetical protein